MGSMLGFCYGLEVRCPVSFAQNEQEHEHEHN